MSGISARKTFHPIQEILERSIIIAQITLLSFRLQAFSVIHIILENPFFHKKERYPLILRYNWCLVSFRVLILLLVDLKVDRLFTIHDHHSSFDKELKGI